ncbi:hypothetical protein N7495_000620 [Penicillium taxi]|uniref:uncharacterized protein n=1 Tax=Penicillium taxi TaxID=168475 RepID=UPI0025454FF6|nr:uncharacterized protein N7495_000620 [Penicillium taxi]KAJ5907938.1 hypothetical protein N7495_000620 [Penicillium taxi]
MGMARMASYANKYVEAPDFRAEQLLFAPMSVSTRLSGFRIDNTASSRGFSSTSTLALPYSAPTSNVTIFCGEKGIATDSVTVTKILQWRTEKDFFQGEGDGSKRVDNTKVIFEGICHGEEVIVNCWDDSKSLGQANTILAISTNARYI